MSPYRLRFVKTPRLSMVLRGIGYEVLAFMLLFAIWAGAPY